jgi:hypothetical protein
MADRAGRPPPALIGMSLEAGASRDQSSGRDFQNSSAPRFLSLDLAPSARKHTAMIPSRTSPTAPVKTRIGVTTNTMSTAPTQTHLGGGQLSTPGQNHMSCTVASQTRLSIQPLHWNREAAGTAPICPQPGANTPGTIGLVAHSLAEGHTVTPSSSLARIVASFACRQTTAPAPCSCSKCLRRFVSAAARRERRCDASFSR